MRILLDACVPRRLAGQLSAHEVSTAHEMGWDDLDDGPLMDAMGQDFDVLVTVDKSMPKQQRLDDRAFGILVLRARTNRLADLLPLLPRLTEALPTVRPGEARELRGPDSPA